MKIKNLLYPKYKIFLKFIFFFNLFIFTFSLDSSLLKINYFQQNSKLYYINALNNDKGDLYFEFWGEIDNFRYLIGINSTSGEEIYFGTEKIFQIEAISSSSIYHESIIISNNNMDNIFSINFNNFDFINIAQNKFSTKTIYQIFNFEEQGKSSYRNCIIKLQNDNYLLSMILQKSVLLGKQHKFISNIFNFISYDMNGLRLNENQQYIDEEFNDYVNSTMCLQTTNKFIECTFICVAGFNTLSLGIYRSNLDHIKTLTIGEINVNAFTKIFHVKNEIGAYIYFDKNSDLPYIQIKKLNSFNNLDKVFNFNYLKLNGNGIYTINSGLFYSDAIKINDNKFVVILTSRDLYNLIICIFDIYNNDLSLRLRYYKLELMELNIKILVNIRAVKFGNLFGISFYNSNLQYPGYLIFNFPNLINDNNYIYNTKIELNLFEDSPSYLFSFPEIIFSNNIFGEEIIGIKIINFPNKLSSGIKIKSINLNSEISINDELNLNDSLAFEPSITGAFPKNNILYFSPIIKELTPSDIETLSDHTFYYGASNDYQEQTFIANSFRLIYKVECHEKCKTCSQQGSDSFYYCIRCVEEFPYNFNNGEKCLDTCVYYIFIDDNGIKNCIENCDNFIYIESDNKKYCIQECNEEQYIYIENDNEKYCLNNCNNDQLLFIDNENVKYCLNNCNNEQFIYIENENEKYCIDNCENDHFI